MHYSQLNTWRNMSKCYNTHAPLLPSVHNNRALCLAAQGSVSRNSYMEIVVCMAPGKDTPPLHIERLPQDALTRRL